MEQTERRTDAQPLNTVRPVSTRCPSPSLVSVPCHFSILTLAAWRGLVVSGVRRMNEVNARRAGLLPGWVTVFGRVYHLGMLQAN